MAAGVAKAKADHITVSGHDGGTGAAVSDVTAAHLEEPPFAPKRVEVGYHVSGVVVVKEMGSWRPQKQQAGHCLATDTFCSPECTMACAMLVFASEAVCSLLSRKHTCISPW